MSRISFLDLSPVAAGRSEADALAETVELARHAESLGAHRYWLAEHHGGAMVASSAPEILIARVAAATDRIRVGSGGMMLPNHAPLHVAEQFKVLEALYPDRIDLGIGRAPGTDQLTALALRRSVEALRGDDFPQRLGEMLAFAGEQVFPVGHPFASVRAAPDGVSLPPVFLLGSSEFSAQLAAAAGLGFAFAAHIGPAFTIDALRAYRAEFKSSARFPEPYAILAHGVVCAETDAEAQRLAAPARVAFRRLRAGAPTPLPSVEDALLEDSPPRPSSKGVEGLRILIGSPLTVRELAGELLERSGADELMAMSNLHGFEDRKRSCSLLADAFDLAPAA